MSLDSPRGSPMDSSVETPLDLATIFGHPAGLRTARHIIRSFIHASQDETTKHDFSSVSIPTFNSSSEVKDQLIAILSFSESGKMALDHHNELCPPSDLYGMPDEPTASARDHLQQILQPTSRSMNRSYEAMFPFSERLKSHGCQFGSGVQPQLIRPSSHNNDKYPSRSNSPAQGGTESPYRVESPSGQSHGLPQYPFKTTAPPILTETSPFQVNLSSTSSASSGQNYHSQASGMRTFQRRSLETGSSQSLRNIFTGDAGRQTNSNTPITKNFSPINKPSFVGTSSSGGSTPNGDDTLLLPGGSTIRQNMSTDTRPSPHADDTAALPIPRAYQHHTPSFITPRTIESSASDTNLPRDPYTKTSKRRASSGSRIPSKKRKISSRPAKGSRTKTEGGDKQSVREHITDDLWMRILEFTPPSFLKKARLVSRRLKQIVDNYDSIFTNQRIEIYGEDMPGPPEELSERQYNDLLGGKGCMEPGCSDKLSSRAHWSWYKRWCTSCWESKVEREDKVIKAHQNQYSRTTVTDMLECIPAGMHDSFMKPHTFVEDGPEDNRSSSAPRIYRCYLKSEVVDIIKKYDALTPAPYKENPEHTAAQKAAAVQIHQEEMAALEQKRARFFEVEKAKNEAHMTKIRKIEECVRRRRELNGAPNQKFRNARRELFTRRAQEDLPHIPTSFVQLTACYKAATRIFRDGGTERGWQTLKPKIVKEWINSEESKKAEKKAMEEAALHAAPVERETVNHMFTDNVERPTPRRSSNHHLFMPKDNTQIHTMMQHKIQQQVHQLMNQGNLPSSRTNSPALFGHYGMHGTFPTPRRVSSTFLSNGRSLPGPDYNSNSGAAQSSTNWGQPSFLPHLQSALRNQYRAPQLQRQAPNATAIPIASLLSGTSSAASSSVGEQSVGPASHLHNYLNMFSRD